MNTNQKIKRRSESLARKTGTNPAWITTLKDIRSCEARNGLAWDGACGTHRADKPGKLVKAKSGSWGRETRTSKGLVVAAITAAECESEGVKPGPANH